MGCIKIKRTTQNKKRESEEAAVSSWWCTPVIQSTCVVETKQSQFESSLGKNVRKMLFQKQVVCDGHICGPSYSGGGGRRITV
jgi:hypothetical protein